MIRTLLIIIAMFSGAIHAIAARPTPSSVREVFVLTETKRQHEEVFPLIESIIKKAIDESVERPLSQEEQRRANSFTEKTVAKLRREISWEVIQEALIPIYQDMFTQEEIDGMLAFYRSPAGIAFIKKMPKAQAQTESVIVKTIEPIVAEVQESAVREVISIRDAKRKG